MRLPWCDTIPLFLCALIGLALVWMGFTTNAIAGKIASDWPVHVFIGWSRVSFVLVVPLWAVLRALDWMCAGPARRAAADIIAPPPASR